MSDKYAEIVVHTHELPFGKRYFTYEWVGSSLKPAWIPDPWFETGKMPWPIKQVDYDISWRRGLYVRVDSRIPLVWLFTKAKIVTQSCLRTTYYRLILTAYVWGLARMESGEAPSWRHLGRRK